MEAELQAVTDAGEGCFEIYESLLEKFSALLAPSHYVILTLKKYIADVTPQTAEKLQGQKISYLKDFIKTAEKVDPESKEMIAAGANEALTITSLEGATVEL